MLFCLLPIIMNVSIYGNNVWGRKGRTLILLKLVLSSDTFALDALSSACNLETDALSLDKFFSEELESTDRRDNMLVLDFRPRVGGCGKSFHVLLLWLLPPSVACRNEDDRSSVALLNLAEAPDAKLLLGLVLSCLRSCCCCCCSKALLLISTAKLAPSDFVKLSKSDESLSKKERFNEGTLVGDGSCLSVVSLKRFPLDKPS